MSMVRGTEYYCSGWVDPRAVLGSVQSIGGDTAPWDRRKEAWTRIERGWDPNLFPPELLAAVAMPSEDVRSLYRMFHPGRIG